MTWMHYFFRTYITNLVITSAAVSLKYDGICSFILEYDNCLLLLLFDS